MYECIFMKILGLFSGALFLEHVTQEVNAFVDGFRRSIGEVKAQGVGIVNAYVKRVARNVYHALLRCFREQFDGADAFRQGCPDEHAAFRSGVGDVLREIFIHGVQHAVALLSVQILNILNVCRLVVVLQVIQQQVLGEEA